MSYDLTLEDRQVLRCFIKNYDDSLDIDCVCDECSFNKDCCVGTFDERIIDIFKKLGVIK